LIFKKVDQFLTLLEVDIGYRNNLKIIWFDFQLGDITTSLMETPLFLHRGKLKYLFRYLIPNMIYNQRLKNV
jgi:hypothetical protein